MTECLSVLGSTGSIGVSTLEVVALHPERYKIFALTANTSVDALFQQCLKYQPKYAVLRDVNSADKLRAQFQSESIDTQVLSGHQGLIFVSEHDAVTSVMAAIVGAAGLEPTLAAVQKGKKVLLANKESLVMAGGLFMEAVAQAGAQLLPIDSEHNAIFQCMPKDHKSFSQSGIRKILLTGSGGPFRTKSIDQLIGVTPEQACAHPNWSMGRKISVDSATMMNKGLEFIEACWMFDVKPSDIDVVIHPQSIIHSMVEYVDGSVLAQLGNPDMRTPIAHAMAWPERIESGVASLDFLTVSRFDFEAPNFDRFPCLKLAMDVAKEGNALAATLNAANEVAVEAFLDKRIAFTSIAAVIDSVLQKTDAIEPSSLAVVKHADAEARRLTHSVLSGFLL
jgi:1-deoxy-D-xylulose-5-phosphate reductoisomerase